MSSHPITAQHFERGLLKAMTLSPTWEAAIFAEKGLMEIDMTRTQGRTARGITDSKLQCNSHSRKEVRHDLKQK